MLITATALEALRTGFSALFKGGLKKAAPKSTPFVTKVSSKTKVETYGFLGDMPVFRRWIGSKRIRSLAEKVYTLLNLDFEATIGIHKNKIADDNLGLYGPIVEGWGESAANLQDRLAFDALAAGLTTVCYDGQNFFDTDHPMGPEETATSNTNNVGTVNAWYLVDCSKPLKPILFQERDAPHFHMVTNMEDSHVMLTGEYIMGGEARGAAGYTFWQLAYRSTATLDAAGYAAAKAALAALTDDEGEPLEVRATHIVVGRSNHAAARSLFGKANLAGGESNIYFNDVAVVEAERLP